MIDIQVPSWAAVLLVIVGGLAILAAYGVWRFAIESSQLDEPRWWGARLAWLALLVLSPVLGLLLWLAARDQVDALLRRLDPNGGASRRGRPGPASGGARDGHR